MKSTFVVLIALFSWTYAERQVSDKCYSDVDNCGVTYYNEEDVTNSDEWETLCSALTDHEESCLDSVTGDQNCLDFVEYTRAFKTWECSHSYEDYSTSMHCMRNLMINGDLYSQECRDEFDEYEASLGYNSTLNDMCDTQTLHMHCVRESMSIHCRSTMAIALQYWVRYFEFYCPESQ